MRTHSHCIGLWLDEDELAHLKSQCELSGLSANTYLRKLLLGETVRPRPPDEYAPLLRELSSIGNNLNQLARKANGLGTASQNDITQAVILAEQAFQLVKEAL